MDGYHELKIVEHSGGFGYAYLNWDIQCSTCCEINCLLYSCCGEHIFYFFRAFVKLFLPSLIQLGCI